MRIKIITQTPTQTFFITIKEYYGNKYFCNFCNPELFYQIKSISTKQNIQPLRIYLNTIRMRMITVYMLKL